MTKNLLIIDDDPMFRFIAKRLVNNALPDKNIKEFENGKLACEFLQAHKSEMQETQILLDINMPVMNGWEFLDACTAETKRPQLEIYIVSSSVDQADKQKAESYSIVKDYIEKPLSKDFILSLK